MAEKKNKANNVMLQKMLITTRNTRVIKKP